MKKIFVLILAVVALAGIGSAGTVPACGTAPIGFATLTGSGFECEAGDYIFTNFDVTSGSVDSSVTATIQISGAQGQIVLFNLNDGDDFTSSFELTYSVALDPTASPASLDPTYYAIVLATAGLQDDGGIGTDLATWQKTVAAGSGTGSGSETITDAAGTTTPSGAITGLAAFTLNVTDAFTLVSGSNGFVVDLSNRYTEADTLAPEPSTMLLLGGALIGLSVVTRKRRS
ncbi:MAG: PEP-CTERM sorting domain-containing protein [Bryobacteraceae bacterium]